MMISREFDSCKCYVSRENMKEIPFCNIGD